MIFPCTKIFPPYLVLIQHTYEKFALENTFKQSNPIKRWGFVILDYYFILKNARKKNGEVIKNHLPI
ncbi:MAG: hypothetical protein A3J85_05560 [Desulfobacula sp. RIFOXYA12_FULL_46_16]|nr:MAG: hypothetical protein A2464_03585 [Deltaproteobacteria bacterium RIFOXYC2_FULL_48_10]OGR21242.1 MAG: hypothetical protein A3J85_05560 [Desulfobacula sp. RIFOXYA12_FULL_46_16]